jgi:signal transduction histidine kinase
MAEPGSLDGQGLIGMRDRIGAVGGRLEIVSSPGAGTTVRGIVPLDPQPAAGRRFH